MIVLVLCGLTEVAVRASRSSANGGSAALLPAMAGHGIVLGGLGALAWVALKVGRSVVWWGIRHHPAHAARCRHHLSLDDGGTIPQCGGAGAGDSRPVGADRRRRRVCRRRRRRRPLRRCGGVHAVISLRAPGPPRFGRIRVNPSVQSFFGGAGPAAIGAIAGSAVSLGLTLQHLWQIPVLGAALLWVLVARRSVVSVLVTAGVVGVAVSLAGVPVEEGANAVVRPASYPL